MLNSHGTPYKAYLKAVTYPNKGIICDQNIEELWRIFNRKFPTKISMLEKFLAYSLAVIEVATTPEMEEDVGKAVRSVERRAAFVCLEELFFDRQTCGDDVPC